MGRVITSKGITSNQNYHGLHFASMPQSWPSTWCGSIAESGFIIQQTFWFVSWFIWLFFYINLYKIFLHITIISSSWLLYLPVCHFLVWFLVQMGAFGGSRLLQLNYLSKDFLSFVTVSWFRWLSNLGCIFASPLSAFLSPGHHK